MEERVTTAGIALNCGHVLIAKREKGGALSGKWEFPGGKNRYGESEEDTLEREYLEELGVRIRVGSPFTSFDFSNGDKFYHLKAYFIELLDTAFTLSVHTEARWVSIDELGSFEMGGSDGKIRDELMAFLLNS